MGRFENQSAVISGASRGIGLAIAKKLAGEGASIAILAKTTEPHPKLEGTIYTAVEEIEAIGGRALAIPTDVRSEEAVQSAIDQAASAHGGIDICVNNASAISLTPTSKTAMKRFDLMFDVNVRGTFLLSRECLRYLPDSNNPHILNISPPLDMHPRWFGPNVAYTMSKFGMSQCVLGMAEELSRQGIAVNALWPHSVIATAAITNVIGDKASLAFCRSPEIMADAAAVILARNARDFTGQFCIDDVLLAETGMTDFSGYRIDSGQALWSDFFVPDDTPEIEPLVMPPDPRRLK